MKWITNVEPIVGNYYWVLTKQRNLFVAAYTDSGWSSYDFYFESIWRDSNKNVIAWSEIEKPEFKGNREIEYLLSAT